MISVIIPIYNAEAYLPRTIRCLREQTFADFEVLLVNDGSTDGSGTICDEVSQLDHRFRHIPQPNGGVSAARNRGIQDSTGAYITFIDADDAVPSGYLSQLWTALSENDAQIAICDVAIISDGLETSRFTCPEGTLSQRQTLNHILSRRNINSGPCAKLFRREVISDLVFLPMKVYEDILFVVEAVCRCDCIAVTDKTEYWYLQNNCGAMGNISRMPAMDIVTATSWLLDFIRKYPELDPMCFYITVSHLMQYVQQLIGNRTMEARKFIIAVRGLIRTNYNRILKCSAFPWKEKVVYLLFLFGWLYHDEHFFRV